MEYQIWKWLHILSSTLLFGTGLGTAFFMFFTNRSGDVRAIAVVTRYVVIADWLFTATTVVFQPLSGLMMMHLAGIPLTARWIWVSFALYFVAGACWLPVVWIQMKLRNLAREAVRQVPQHCRASTGNMSASGCCLAFRPLYRLSWSFI